jgi:hypothetical protein
VEVIAVVRQKFLGGCQQRNAHAAREGCQRQVSFTLSANESLKPEAMVVCDQMGERQQIFGILAVESGM